MLCTASPLFAYTQTNLKTARDGSIETIPLEATVQESPAQIRIKSYAAGTFSIYRKSPSVRDWGTAVATGISLSAEGIWTDSSVSVGTLYEYKFVNTAGTAYSGRYPTGYILTGINVDQTLPKGRMAVVVASDVLTNLPVEYAQYKDDLVADGWTVHEIPCPRAANNYGIGNAAIATLKIDAGGTGYTNGDTVYLTNAGGKKAAAKLVANTSGVITSATVLPGGGGTGFAVGEVLTMSGQTVSGTGATLLGHINSSQLTLTYAEALVGGSGYTNGQLVTLTGQTSGKTAQGTLIADASGMIYYFNNITGQTGFIQDEPVVMSGNTTGSGVGPLTAAGIDAQGNLQWVDIHGFGSGYTDGDTATLTGQTSGKTAQVTLNVDANGAVSWVDLVSSQSGFVEDELLVLSGASTGSGAGLFRASSVGGPLQSIQVVSGGSGYVNGNVVTIRYGSTDAQGVLNVTNGAITSVSITSGGAGFTEGNYVYLSGLTSTATGASLSVLTVDNSGAGRAVVVSAGGSGYRDNDRATITGNASGATARGSLIAPGGSVVAVATVLPGTFTAGESLTITPASGGSGATATAGASTEYHLLIRNAIQAVNNAYPGELQNVVMVGKVPVCRSGINDGAASDGHGNAAPYGADAFYADMDGVVGTDWTDTQDLKPGNLAANLSGDKQFDQEKISEVGNGRTELGFGRIDLSLGIQTETEALRTYFKKLHRYKTASPDFQPGRRVCDRLSYPNEREANLQSMPGVVGMDNIEFIGTSALPNVEGGQDADQLYSNQHGPYLFYFKGSGGPSGGVGGKAVFWTGMQSHWGYWYEQGLVSSGANAMQKRLAEDSFTLSFTWNIWGMRYLYHRMGMGKDAGDMMKESISNNGWTNTGTNSGPYTYRFDNVSNGDFHGSLYMNHMGDPALRLFMFEPPSALSVVKTAGQPVLTWTASPNASVTGYHIYRSAHAAGPFTRLTGAPQAGTTYTDSSASSGAYYYMVRAVRLETTGGGTFYNASLGTTQYLNLDAAPAALSISTSTLPVFNWSTPGSASLSAQGGFPQYAWSLESGALPTGLSLSPAGLISGTPTATGTFNLTLKVTDQTGQTATRALQLTVDSSSSIIVYPDATTYTNKAAAGTSYGSEEITQISGVSTSMYETFHRYNLAGLPVYNGLTKATLYLYVASGTAAGVYAPVQANLIADAQDGWVDNGIAKPFSDWANNGSNKVRITCPSHGFTTGTQVAIAGLTGTGAPTSGPYPITVVDANTFDLLTVAFVSGWTYDPALAFATTASTNYNTRPTTYNPNVSTLLASGNPTAGTWLQFDVTPFVRETLASDATKRMSIRFFTQTGQTVVVGSQFAFGGARPYLVFETSNAPSITVNSPTVNPACVYTGSGIMLNTTVTPLPALAGSLTLQWSKVSGPGTVTFSNATAATTGASFSAAGEYVLRLTANDSEATSTRDITVRVLNVAVAGPFDSSLKMRLALDETSGTAANDSSGVSPANNGTLVNAPAWSSSGKNGGALSFVGNAPPTAPTGQKITVPDSATHPLDGMSQLSISMWIKPSSLPVGTTVYAGLIAKRVGAFNKESYRMELRGSATGASSPVYLTITGGTTLQGTTQLTAGNWYHLVAVFDGTQTSNNLRLFVNGTPDRFTTITPTSVARNNTAPLLIGSNDVYDFNGLMDEVRIYNRALTQSEVSDLYAVVPANMGPVVSAGAPVSGNAGDLLTLSGTATDDGLPGGLTLGWSVFSGPGSVIFGNAAAASTTANFAQPGEFSLRLTASDGAITTWANTTASITAPPGIDTWRQLYFGTTDATGNRADSANPAGDGISNLVKYALGLDPTKAYSLGGAGLILQVPAIGSGNYLSYSFTGTASDVTYIVEAVSDLTGTWTTLYTHSGSAPGSVTVQDNQAVTAGSKRFMRLRVTHP